ncbi:flagellar type III secretion system pore protein FliP [Novosphingobium aerophilum]|uniref:flagellar type III secretion system pore protein FliP n=1 Tax=Novosphingobium TaxID=165696 RepID=UPI0006C86697|nr:MULTISPECIES: flagellar type III secretion system pore protein FliP [unclassified Novosphingobium]KPH62793.1 flagellar biosynthetic protein flip [Novosphingobium sp. ST904]MPS71251.1 flagellar type III secretion system pore protein FliP [Novosphingobium sp.]TCM39193.1 flagellar biosynthetic protein FliP [Novosphingobium sp. ST904]WRT92752.1 flagellar type III secretion system pore protein FliP [Novosphingobium sp. RL4]
MPKRYAVLAALAGAAILAVLPEAAMAQKAAAGPLGEGAMSGRVIQLVLLMTVLSLAPGILMTITSFTRIIVALSLLRSGLGVQGVPPNPVVISLALFLSFFVMAPTFDAAWKDGMVPYNQGRINETQALERASKPFHTFMLKQVRDDDVKLFVQLSGKVPASRAELPMTTLMPAFMISELRRAFEIGFLLLLPFLVIDLAVAAVLMAMGMMMLPPATISLPMKIIFFVLVDGWALIAGSLVKSFGGPG